MFDHTGKRIYPYDYHHVPLSIVLNVYPRRSAQWFCGNINDDILARFSFTAKPKSKFHIWIKRNFRENIRGMLSTCGYLMLTPYCEGVIFRAVIQSPVVTKWAHQNHGVLGFVEEDGSGRWYCENRDSRFKRLAIAAHLADKQTSR